MTENKITSPYPPTTPTCWNGKNCITCTIEPCYHSTKIQEAIRLIQIGARGRLVGELTELPKKLIKRLYRQLHEHASPQGRTPYTDAWFAETEQRMLHASIVWRIHIRITARTQRTLARQLLDVFDIYHFTVPHPLLDITRIVTVIRLAVAGVWHKRQCDLCTKLFLAPSEEESTTTCPGCKLYHRHRCRHCGTALRANPVGRPHSACGQCNGTPTITAIPVPLNSRSSS